MEKVCVNWPEKAFISGLVDAKYWTDFEANATAAAAQVYKVADTQQERQNSRKY